MQKMSGEAWRKLRVCVDSYDHQILAGRFYHPGSADGCTFHSAIEFLMTAERLMDEAKFPQSYETKRSFVPVAECFPEGAGGRPQDGAKATFIIRLVFRQHASWQGSVTWLEGGGEQSFRSVLELLLLLDSALSGEGA